VSVRVLREDSKQGRTFARRSELEVKMDILRVVGEGWRKPTQIMYKSNLSWIALQDHFKSLAGGGLLREVRSGKRMEYELTAPGLSVLQDYRRLTNSIKQTMTTAPTF
jgi:predicted transcriptional regulator